MRQVMSVGAAIVMAVALLSASGACGQKNKDPEQEPHGAASMKAAMAPMVTGMKPRVAPRRATAKKPKLQATAKRWLKAYLGELAALEKVQTAAYWKAANSGRKDDFKAFAAAELALKKLHSNKKRYREIVAFLKGKKKLLPLQRRSLEVALLAFKGNQLPKAQLEALVGASTDIEQVFKTHRGTLDGKPLPNNTLLELLKKEKNSARRKAIWGTLKQVGGPVGPKLVALAKLRNKAAKTLGYANFWDMHIRLQEHDPAHIIRVFAELDKTTLGPFRAMKAELDGELAKRFGIPAASLMPWHYDNPFFQAAPPSAAIDLDTFFKGKKKEDIVSISARFYADIGVNIDTIIKRSDLFQRPGKDQHAFCIAMDRQGDVRMLTNIKPTVDWMETLLHEIGHAIYYAALDFSLPYNLREAAHIFTTEAIAMLFGALAKNPTWLQAYLAVPAAQMAKAAAAIRAQRRREQLIFARWTLVMLNFEKALYEKPDQDLNKLWWDTVARYQLLTRPPNRSQPDWASKPHFTIAPVYYHNYMLGELLAAQLRKRLATLAKHAGPPSTLSFNGRKDFGSFLAKQIFRPGMRDNWPTFVKRVTGEPLTARYFAAEVK